MNIGTIRFHQTQVTYTFTLICVVHLGSSIPTNEYSSEEKVDAAKPQKYPVPSEFPHIISGKHSFHFSH